MIQPSLIYYSTFYWHDLFIQYSTFIREHSVIDSPVIPSYAVANTIKGSQRLFDDNSVVNDGERRTVNESVNNKVNDDKATEGELFMWHDLVSALVFRVNS